MFIFAIKIILGLLLITWFGMMFVEIFKKKPVTFEDKISHIKANRETFGVSDASIADDAFENDEIVVYTPEQLGLNSTGGGTY